MTMNLNLPAIILSQAVDPVITHCILYNYIMTMTMISEYGSVDVIQEYIYKPKQGDIFANVV